MKQDKKRLKCKLCNREWEEVCQQTQCIRKYGRCLACLAKDNPIEELDYNKVEQFLEVNKHKLTPKINL